MAKKEMLYAGDLGADEKEAYLGLLREGMKPNTAAKECGSTGTQFRKLRNPQSVHFDAKFSRAFDEAMTSEQHREALLERLRDMIWAKAEAGDTTMLQKLALIYDPDWEPLRHQNFRAEIDVLIRRLPELGLTRDQIEKAIAAEERRLGTPVELKMLPAASDVHAA